MKYLVGAFLLIGLFASMGTAQITYVGSAGSRYETTPNGDLVLTLGSAISSGTKVLICYHGHNANNGVASATDSGSNTYGVINETAGVADVALVYGDISTGLAMSDTITLTLTSSGAGDAGFIADVFSGMATGAPTSQNSNSGSGTSLTGGSVSFAATGYLGYMCGAAATGSITFTADTGAGYAIGTQNGGADFSGAGQYKIKSDTTSENPALTSSNVSWGAINAAFADAGGGGGGPSAATVYNNRQQQLGR